MGRTKRKYSHELVLFFKRMKKPLQNIAEIMPIGFTNDLFYFEFKQLYTYLWDDIKDKSMEYKRMDEGLAKKGFPKRYFFPPPSGYLIEKAIPYIWHIRNAHSFPDFVIDREQQQKDKATLLANCNKKLADRKAKIQENLKLVQLTTPEYTNYYISAYFDTKKCNPIDVDNRYVILQEASKYKSLETVKFLHKVNASERNFHLRYFAFTTLQKFGIKEIRLRKNRKGKKRVGDKLVPNEITTPDELINHIYNSQLEQTKTYDLFLSHSSLDSAILLETKAILNSADVNVYIDWVCDKNSLKRKLTNVNTANVIIERLKSSKSLMYILTSASLDSKWTPWELGYFHALKNKICIYMPVEIKDIPPYLEIYPTATFRDNAFYVVDSGKEYDIGKWIKL